MRINKDSIIRYVLLLGSVGFVISGIMRNETAIVLKKAINICLECIGVG